MGSLNDTSIKSFPTALNFRCILAMLVGMLNFIGHCQNEMQICEFMKVDKKTIVQSKLHSIILSMSLN